MHNNNNNNLLKFFCEVLWWLLMIHRISYMCWYQYSWLYCIQAKGVTKSPYFVNQYFLLIGWPLSVYNFCYCTIHQPMH